MINEYLNTMKFNGLAESTIRISRRALEKLNNFKPLDQVEKKDLIEFFNGISGNYAPGYISLLKVRIKKYYADTGKPELVSWMKIAPPEESLDEREILTVEDINKMIEVTSNPMRRALIAIMFETGARIGEVLNVTVEDITDDAQGMIIKFENIKTRKNADTKYRKNLLIFAAQYVRNLIIYKGLEKKDRLFDIKHVQAWHILTDAGIKANVNKPTNPHAFRHAAATDAVRRQIHETIIRKKLGWTTDSRMIRRYVHLLDDDVIEATRAAYGAAIVEKKDVPTINTTDPLKIADAGAVIQAQAEQIEELKEQMQFIMAALKVKKEGDFNPSQDV